MNTKEYINVYNNEKSHFFYVANHEIILSLIKHFFPKAKLKILDAGCGTGLLTKKLKKFGEVIGVDNHQQAIELSKKRGLNVKKSSIEKLPFKGNTFDLVTCIDVIYHLNIHDQSALQEIFRVLKPGGITIIRVPANKWLKLAHDKHVHLRERYSEIDLRERLIRTGFIIKKLSFVNMSLLPLAAINHLFQKINPPKENNSSISKVPNFLNKALITSLTWEKHALKLTPLPFGLGLLAICQKPLKT
jgi:ubiquinone/menaquinone biosynthesis C-methylase UbiE